MQVISCEPNGWYLLEANGKHYIDVNCEQSAVSFSILIELNEQEYSEYHALGRVFLNYFAAKVNYWSREFWARNISGALNEQATQAIKGRRSQK